MRKGPVDYDTHVWCSHCGVKHFKAVTEFISNWGYKCPDCGRKCRVKAKDINKTNPYKPSSNKPYQLVREIKSIAEVHDFGKKRKELV